MMYTIVAVVLCFLSVNYAQAGFVVPARNVVEQQSDHSKSNKPAPEPLEFFQFFEYPFIVGGIYAAPGEFPYIVSLQVNGEHFCGGSIMNENWILSAAHCLTGLENEKIEILAGTTKTNGNGVRRTVAIRAPHDDYQPKVTNDLALLKLDQSLPANNPYIKAIALPKADTPAGTYCVVAGWGYNQTGQNVQENLKKLLTRIVPDKNCTDTYRGTPITHQNICAFTRKNEGFCQGDSGGPLVDSQSKTNGYPFQVGIVSANVPCAQGYPDIYTRVWEYVDDIDYVINNF